ncbi:hypothetical protein F383_38201 [Gossypium arboreum]|uniref:Uncharacterized protein n=1 Tax=Gossypium arboreum TaxID=29729 RepID=A0A0B0MJF6_GOSAR|nr:hypothetical protein F383_38201 [Gossypium arboreum]
MAGLPVQTKSLIDIHPY